MKAPLNQTVGYVAPPAKAGGPVKILKGVVTEAYVDDSARLDITPRNDKGEAVDADKAPLGHHTAIAAFNSDKKTENTWHPLDEAAAPSPAPAPAPGK